MPDAPSNVELAVRVGVLEAQVGSLQTNLSSHQNYVAGEFGKMETKVEAQSKKISENHQDVKTLLVDVAAKCDTLIARNQKEDGAQEANDKTDAAKDKLRAQRQPFIVAALSAILTGAASYFIVRISH